jgi:hypothetical protein
MSELTITPVPNPDPVKWANYGAHRSVYNGVCGDCGPLIYKGVNYESYVAQWYANEYEGEPGHAPESREDYEYIRDSCYARPLD